MPQDLLQSGAAWLEGQRHEHLAHDVEYVRLGDVVTLRATVGRTSLERDDGQAVTQQFETRDFLIRAEDLLIAGERALPLSGDQIRETIGGDEITFEVMSPLPGLPVFEYADQNRSTFRVHTKRVTIEESE